MEDLVILKKKVAVVIKHPYRDNDIRVDIIEVPENMYEDEIRSLVMQKMLGPFEVVYVTEKIELNRKL